jgi:flagellar basal body-associated protein FliL
MVVIIIIIIIIIIIVIILLYSSILYIFTCLLNSPKVNYKVNTGKGKMQNKHIKEKGDKARQLAI